MSLNIDSLQKFLSRYPYDAITDPNKPRVIFPSAYELNRSQEDAMMAELQRRVNTLKKDTGWTATEKLNWYGTISPALMHQSSPAYTHFGKRELGALMHRGQVDWRPNVFGGLFVQSNLHLPMTRKVTRQMASRAKNYFTGTSPWFGMVGRFADDVDPAIRADQVAQWQFEQAKGERALNTAIDLAFIHGESIIKVIWKDQRRYYRQFAEVAMFNGRPIQLQNGDYIYRDDLWVRAPDGLMQLVRGGEFTDPFAITPEEYAALQFEMRPVMRERIVCQRLDFQNKFFRDILVTPNAKSINEAKDFVELFDAPRTDIATRYLGAIAKSGDTRDMPNVLRLLRSISGSGNSFHSGTAQPRADLHETGSSSSTTGGMWESLVGDNIQFAEHYAEIDADEDGYAEKITCLYDLQSGYPIAYDYVDNVTASGNIPYVCLRINPVDNRWHGIGQPEIFWQLQNAIDLFVNRMNWTVSKEGRVDIIRREAFLNLDRDNIFSINGGETLELAHNAELKDSFQSINLGDPQRVDHLKGMIDMLSQAFITLSGTMSINDGAAVADLDSMKLATGQNHLKQENAEAFAPLLGDLEEGAKEMVQMGVETFLTHLDDGTSYKFFEGAEPQWAEYKRVEFKALKYDVEIKLSTYHAEQELTQLQATVATAKDYVAQPPPFREAMQKTYTRMLELFQAKGVEPLMETLKMIPPLMLPPGPESTGNPAAAAQSEPSMTDALVPQQ